MRIKGIVYLDEKPTEGVLINLNRKTTESEKEGHFELQVQKKSIKSSLPLHFNYAKIDTIYYEMVDTTIDLINRDLGDLNIYLNLIEKPIWLKIYVNDAPTKDVEVLVFGEKYKSDEHGMIVLKNKRNQIKINSSKARFKYDQVDFSKYHSIDTLINLNQIESNEIEIPILLNLNKKASINNLDSHNKEEVSTISDANNKLNSLESVLDDSKELLEDFSNEQEEYVTQHPNSAIIDFKPDIEQLKVELGQLYTELKQLKEDLKKSNKKGRLGEYFEINEFNQGFIQLNSKVNNYTRKLVEERGIFKGNLAHKPDMIANTDIFFGSGEFKMGQLNTNERMKIDSFTDSLVSLISDLDVYQPNELNAKIKVVGFTDGESVGSQLSIEISKLCKASPYSSKKVLNQCLSELRAKELSELIIKTIRSQLPNYLIISEVEGRGEELAKNNRKDSSIRRCDISFVVKKRP